MGFLDKFRGRKVENMKEFEGSVRIPGCRLTKHEVTMLYDLSSCPDCCADADYWADDYPRLRFNCSECGRTFVVDVSADPMSGQRGKLKHGGSRGY